MIPEQKFLSSPAYQLTQDSFDVIVAIVCARYKLRPVDIVGRVRTADLVEPRHIAVYLCRQLTPHPLHSLARCFQRDHTALVHAEQTMRARIETDARFAAHVEKLAAQAKLALEQKEAHA